VLTDEERAEALARYQARLDALPPRSEEWRLRIAALFASIRLRMARDRARAYLDTSDAPGHNRRDISDLPKRADCRPKDDADRQLTDVACSLGEKNEAGSHDGGTVNKR
jgi:hypothetical protein